MRQLVVYALPLIVFFCTSCGQSSTGTGKEKGRSSTINIAGSPRSNDAGIYRQYEYVGDNGARMVVTSGFPRCGARFTDRNGTEYIWSVFWSRIINETGNRLDVDIEFPVDVVENSSSAGNYFKVLVPPDTMTVAKMSLYNYGLQDMDSFLDTSIHKTIASLKRSVNPNDSTGFLVVVVSRLDDYKAGTNAGVLRTALSLKGSSLFYTISRYASKRDMPLIDEKEIPVGSVNWRGEEMK